MFVAATLFAAALAVDGDLWQNYDYNHGPLWNIEDMPEGELRDGALAYQSTADGAVARSVALRCVLSPLLSAPQFVNCSMGNLID